MAIDYLLAPIPKWVLINNQGTVAGGGRLFTYRSLNKVQPKIVYQDAGGTIPYTNPIVFDLNGVQGPFYWEVDSANPDDTYYLEAYEAPVPGSGADRGPLLWTLDDYAPQGSGGGGDVTTYLPLLNYIANNQFIDHADDTTNPIGVTNLNIAPSNHKGFTPVANAIVGTFGVVGPDIRFVKNNINATDQITFPLFPLASNPLIGDVTPVEYVRYQCTNSPLGETYKAFQFPICQKVKNLSNQAMTFKIWAAVTATPVNINIYVRQYFGSGSGSSAEVRTLIGTCSLTTTWTDFNIPFVVPDVAGKSIGTPGSQTDDDALYIQVEMPLGQPCDVLFTKPALYLGTIDPDLDFEDYDQINSINSTPRTGDVRVSLTTSAPRGWIPMNDGSIGNVGSLASIRRNKDTFQLFKTIWDGVVDPFAPVSDGRGASALADFLANKTLTLPRSLGRALAGAGAGSGLTARSLGQFLGSETISAAAMPAHTHGPLAGTGFIQSGGGTIAASIGTSFSIGATTGVTGGGAADGNMPPTTFMNVFIKL
ncbi:TPA: hypothetical protein ACPSKZ_000687 [Legionella anisa]|uniref:hypothetical protein n=1 Tax=Legionella anisa TaxID=28082 RepID=UPI0022440929|nr:hypothetical protein [Legionella anisa]MCW8425615.1 hypothetical protein [Legionella anisa]MCW8448956.1 hypothetical protein [Legionella anisa]